MNITIFGVKFIYIYIYIILDLEIYWNFDIISSISRDSKLSTKNLLHFNIQSIHIPFIV